MIQPGAPLGNNAGFVTPSTGSHEDRVSSRYRLRDVHRSLAKSSNQRKCGRVRLDPVVEVRRGGHGGARLHGLVSCGSWSACPVCSHRIATARGAEIMTGLERHIESGGDVLLLTPTVRHDAGDRLDPLYRGFSRAWRAVQQGAPWKRWRDRLGIVGMIRGTDTTHGPHGWHPHLHILILTDGRRSARELVEFRRWIRERWEAMVRRHIGDKFAPVWRHGVTLFRGASAGAYVAKLGLAREVSSMATKGGRVGHRTPFEILADLATWGRKGDRRLWREWVTAMHGKVHIFWGRGLRAKLLPEQPERTDAEIMDGVGDDEAIVTVIPADEWDRIASLPGVPARIVAAARSGSGLDVRAVIADALRRAPPRAPKDQRELQYSQDAIGSKIRWETAAREIRTATRADRAAGVPYRVHYRVPIYNGTRVEFGDIWRIDPIEGGNKS